MGFEQKIELFHAQIESTVPGICLLDPLVFRALRSVGINIRPPVFQPMWFNMLIVFVGLDAPLTALTLAWPSVFPDVSLLTLLLFNFIATISCAALALILSLAWWHQKTKLKLPDWNIYGA